MRQLPSLKCSEIEGQVNDQKAFPDMDRVDWNDLLMRSSFPEDYGTIRITDTQREHNEKLEEQSDQYIVKNFR